MLVIFLCLLSVFWTQGKVHGTHHVDAWPEMRTETFWTKLKLKEWEKWDWHKHTNIQITKNQPETELKYIHNMYPYVWCFMLMWWRSIDWWPTAVACHKPWINLKIRLKMVLFGKWPVIWHCVCNARQWPMNNGQRSVLAFCGPKPGHRARSSLLAPIIPCKFCRDNRKRSFIWIT